MVSYQRFKDYPIGFDIKYLPQMLQVPLRCYR